MLKAHHKMPFLRTHLLLLYRYLFAMPWRSTLACTKTNHRPSQNQKPPLPHPIDAEYGIDTSGALFGPALHSGNFADAYTTAYAGSQPSFIRKILNLIPRLEEATFLDLGCGKGRALAAATEFPLADIIGVELSPKCASIARNNARILREKFPERTPVTVLEADAAASLMPEGQVIVFLYNPFFRRLMKKTLANIERALTSNPNKKIFVAYANPVSGDLFDASPYFKRLFAEYLACDPEEQNTGAAFGENDDALVIWESVSTDMLPPHPNATAKIKISKSGWHAQII
jgi:SAM-dependent methyltransferase